MVPVEQECSSWRQWEITGSYALITGFKPGAVSYSLISPTRDIYCFSMVSHKLVILIFLQNDNLYIRFP